MQITLNNIAKNIQAECTLQLLLDDILSGRQSGIAVAVNNIVIAKTNWPLFKINSKDDVLIINATQGG